MGTTSNGYPYPEDTAALAGGARAIKDLATAVNSLLRKTAAGRGTVVLTKVAAASLAVNFPSGRFTAVPAVTVRVTEPIARSTVRHYQGTSATVHVIVDWQAMVTG